ncbi:hypothetical protein IMX23_14350 (plasmid) [Listeria seeligeri]|uniref:hypothetical protein n=2 Tax=Listeria seeligeri TaxID=1640 RepID=UPI0018B0A433|nr:hypothetical protein [Listeria seeligeri]QPJ28047.1 hypothetical protein IMX23_14350 [Listeria seeligeri]
MNQMVNRSAKEKLIQAVIDFEDIKKKAKNSEKLLCKYINSKIYSDITEEKLVFIMEYADSKIADYNRSKWMIIKFVNTIVLALTAGLFAMMTYFNNQLITLKGTHIDELKEQTENIGNISSSLNGNEVQFGALMGLFIGLYLIIVFCINWYQNFKSKKWIVLHSNTFRAFLNHSQNSSNKYRKIQHVGEEE